MITCRDLYGFLDEFLADGLDLPTQVAFRAHLAVCRACRRYLRTYEAALAAAKTAEAVPVEEPPEELVQAILAARAALPLG
jgi:predicted anti-sigma-YlaC factor YlaD